MLFGHFFFVFLQLFSYLNYVWLSKNTNMLNEKRDIVECGAHSMGFRSVALSSMRARSFSSKHVKNNTEGFLVSRGLLHAEHKNAEHTQKKNFCTKYLQ